MAWNWSFEVEQADWIVRAAHPFAQDVGSVIPDHFEAYARIFHPLSGVAAGSGRWSDLAASNGRIAHPEMQFHRIAVPAGASSDLHLRVPAAIGTLPEAELLALVDILSRCGDPSDRCWFAIWVGYGQLEGGSAAGSLTPDGGVDGDGIVPAHVWSAKKILLPHRGYLIAEGALADLPTLHDDLWQQSPNLWWPDDRSWCVSTEVDFAWTYIGGSRALVNQVLADERLEALPAAPDHEFTVHADTTNEALDEAPPDTTTQP